MKLLVTAGNSQAPIDRVRCVTNVFSGRTGAAIALHAHERGHAVTLLTSHPEAVGEAPPADRWALRRYRTFEELHERMAGLLTGGGFDALVHCAAVSDYLAGGVYAPAAGSTFRPETGRWEGGGPDGPALLDRQADKVRSDEPELWLRLVRAPKLVDQVREPWGFRGLLVKFKLEVGVTDEQLLATAERSRVHSAADFMVANTLENGSFTAFLGPVNGGYERLVRRDLPGRLVAVLEGAGHG